MEIPCDRRMSETDDANRHPGPGAGQPSDARPQDTLEPPQRREYTVDDRQKGGTRDGAVRRKASASADGISRRYIRRLVGLAFLSSQRCLAGGDKAPECDEQLACCRLASSSAIVGTPLPPSIDQQARCGCVHR